MTTWPAVVCPRCRTVLDAAGEESGPSACGSCEATFPTVHGVRFLAADAPGEVETWQKAIYDAFAHQPYAGWRLGRAPDITLTYWSHCRHIAALPPRAGETVLDVGCLDGRRLFEILACVDATGVGVDLSTAAIGAARAARHPRARFHAASAEALPLPDSCCDVALAMDVLEHTASPATVVGEVRRCLRSGGRFLAHLPVTDNGGSYDAWLAAHRPAEWAERTRTVGHDYARMPTSAEARAWLERAGFADVRVERFNAWHQNRFDYHAVHRVLNTLFFVCQLPLALYHDLLIHVTKVWYHLDRPRLARGIGGSVYVSGRVRS